MDLPDNGRPKSEARAKEKARIMFVYRAGVFDDCPSYGQRGWAWAKYLETIDIQRGIIIH